MRATLISLGALLFVVAMAGIAFWYLLTILLTDQQLKWFVIGYVAASAVALLGQRFGKRP